jgi:hypothetical protein
MVILILWRLLEVGSCITDTVIWESVRKSNGGVCYYKFLGSFSLGRRHIPFSFEKAL